MNTETRGTLSRRGNISQITNAFVEEVNAFSNTSTGYIIVSYAASPGQQSDNIQMLRLNINRNTVILDSSGQVISLSEIRPQTWINAVFSSAMTRSIPPQANAFLIMVQRRRPQIEIATSIGRIASIDAANGFLYTGNPNDINSQVRYVVSNSTFSDPSGRPITLSSLRPSQRVRITHDLDGRIYPIAERVARIGNSVVPEMAKILVMANCSHLKTGERIPNMIIKAEQNGQLRFA